jgi:hypothetical protein
MGFWKTSGYGYQDILDIPMDRLLLLVNSMTRGDLIEWLSWNDPNGIYLDEQSLKEFGNTMSKEDGMEILLRQVEENRIVAK